MNGLVRAAIGFAQFAGRTHWPVLVLLLLTSGLLLLNAARAISGGDCPATEVHILRLMPPQPPFSGLRAMPVPTVPLTTSI